MLDLLVLDACLLELRFKLLFSFGFDIDVANSLGAFLQTPKLPFVARVLGAAVKRVELRDGLELQHLVAHRLSVRKLGEAKLVSEFAYILL